MAINFATPATTDNYLTQFVPNIQGNQIALARWLDSTNDTITGTVPTFTKRYNRSTAFIQEYNGVDWTNFTLNILGNASTATTLNSFAPGQLTEVGRYFDFHGTNAGTDWDVRLDSGPGTGVTNGGTLTVSAAGGIVAASFSGVGTNLTGTASGLSIGGNAATASSSNTSGTATQLSATNQIALITGRTSGLAMTQDGGAQQGSFTCRASGVGDGNLAGLTFWNDSYAIKLGVRADGFVGLGGWSRTAWSWYSDPSGNMVAAGNITAYSDPRLKENFTVIPNALDILSVLDGGTFNWKHGYKHTECKAGKKDYGILADQVERIMPEIVTSSIEIEGKTYKTVSYEKLVPVLIEAVKTLNLRSNEQLKSIKELQEVIKTLNK